MWYANMATQCKNRRGTHLSTASYRLPPSLALWHTRRLPSLLLSFPAARRLAAAEEEGEPSAAPLFPGGEPCQRQRAGSRQRRRGSRAPP